MKKFLLALLLLALAVPARGQDVLRIDATSIKLDSKREIIALWASIPFGAKVQRGSAIPLDWTFSVHENTIPGVTYITAFTNCVSDPLCSTPFISGQALEIAQLSDCVEVLFPEPNLSGLVDITWTDILTDCTGRGCCCIPTLLVLPGDGCPVGTDERSWSRVKQLFN